MTLGSGRFGPALKTEHTEKHWPPLNPEKKLINRTCNEIHSLNEFQNLRYWLITNKQYGAEWQQELDDWSEYMGWVVFEKQNFFKNMGVKYDN